MGEARRRGTPEQRAQAALAAARAKFPATVKCNRCQVDLADITPLDTRGMPGLRLAGVAHCKACESQTMVLDGDPESLAQFAAFMQDEKGDVLIGTERKPGA